MKAGETKGGKRNWKKLSFAGLLLLLLVGGLSFWGWRSYRARVALMEKVKLAMSNPNGLTPKKLVSRLDDSFSSLPESEQERIVSDPKLLSERVREASYANYKRAFGDLFMLPGPVRRKLIENSARSVAASVEKDPRKVDAFYESDAGKAALRAASEYFFVELSGRQKAELKPLTDAFFKVQQDRAKRGRR